MQRKTGLQEADIQKLHTTPHEQLTDYELLLRTICAEDLDRKHSSGSDNKHPKCLLCSKAYRFKTFTCEIEKIVSSHPPLILSFDQNCGGCHVTCQKVVHIRS
jgi:hypothetical protein